MMVQRYKIICNKSWFDLQEEVNKHAEEGWTVYQPLVVTELYFFQPITKYEMKEEK